jgi:3-deoxy-D-manno-octulosonic-acid transferase
MQVLYSIGLGALLALTLPWWVAQMLRHGKYRAGLAERLGRLPARLTSPPPEPGGQTSSLCPCIWVHAVSVGEVLAISGLVNQLGRHFPAHRIVISTTTAAAQKLARTRFGEQRVFYFPLDFGFAIRPYLHALRPELVVIAETEFWPNFLRLTKASGARIAVVNARISDRSFPRYRALRTLMRSVLSRIDLFLAQSEEDARRLRLIGAPANRVQVSGNLKFDVAKPKETALVAELRAALRRSGADTVVVCGSTLDGEEAMLLHVFRQLLVQKPGLVMVLAPRHPERFAAVGDLLRASGIPFWRRSQWQMGKAVRGGVFLLDSIGELASMYSLADVAFVGGSLVPRGGHNILEAAQFALPIIVGPHTENFRDMIALFRREGAVIVAEDADALLHHLRHFLAQSDYGRQFGARAARVLKQHSGATARTLESLQILLKRPAAEVPAS